jgi:hypothetical protein
MYSKQSTALLKRLATLKAPAMTPNASAIVKKFEEGRASDSSALLDADRVAVNTVLCEGEKALKDVMLPVTCHVGEVPMIPCLQLVAGLSSSWTSPSAMEPNTVMQRDGFA